MIYFFLCLILLYGGVIGGDKLWIVSKFSLDNRNYRFYGITWTGKQCSNLILEWTLVKGRSSWPQKYFVYIEYLKWKYTPLTQIKMWKMDKKEKIYTYFIVYMKYILYIYTYIYIVYMKFVTKNSMGLTVLL